MVSNCLRKRLFVHCFPGASMRTWGIKELVPGTAKLRFPQGHATCHRPSKAVPVASGHGSDLGRGPGLTKASAPELGRPRLGFPPRPVQIRGLGSCQDGDLVSASVTT